VIAYREYDHDPRVAGWLLMAYGGGSVLGSFATYFVLARFAPVPIAIVAAAGLAAPMWLLVPHVPLAVMILALGIIGFSNPLTNAPYFGILSKRVPAPLLPKVIQVIITSNQVAGPLGFAIAGFLFASIGLQASYLIAAVVGTAASLNFILAVTSSPSRPAPAAA
jgi:predicted MFS family arabinose efflux permease